MTDKRTNRVSIFDTFEQALGNKQFADAARLAKGSFGMATSKYVRKAMQAALDARDPEQAHQIAVEFGDLIPDSMVTGWAILQLEVDRTKHLRSKTG